MRLIDADELLKKLGKLWNIPDDWDGDIEPLCEDAFTLIEDAPTIDAAPVVHGFNDNRNYHEVDEFRCSECGLHLEDWIRHVYDEEMQEEWFTEYKFKHCPECGAKMEGDEE